MYFFFQAEDGIRDYKVTGVQTCALPILFRHGFPREPPGCRGDLRAACRLAGTVRAAAVRLPRAVPRVRDAAGRGDARVDRKSGGEGKRGDLRGCRNI